jgi:type II secretory pathway component HofQ
MTGKRTKEQQLQVGKEWNEAKAKGEKIEDFCAAAGLGTISVANYERAYRKSLQSTTTPAAKAAPKGSSLESEIEATVAAQMKAARIAAWTTKIAELEGQLKQAKGKLAELQPKPDEVKPKPDVEIDVKFDQDYSTPGNI